MPKLFKVNGKPFDFDALPPKISLAIKLLEALPSDELIDSQELSKKLDIQYSSGGHWRIVGHAAMAKYYIKFKGKSLFGSSAAIAELKRRLGAKAG